MKKTVLIGANIAAAVLLATFLFANPQIHQVADYQGIVGETVNSNILRFIVIGDYGFEGLDGQYAVADKMSEVAKAQNVSFVLATGDNFYDPDGIRGVKDPNWQTHWSSVYKANGRLSGIPWYSTQGNHDYNSPDLFAQFQYRQHDWKFGALFWQHSHRVQSALVTFVHVDTSFLAYGINGQPGTTKPLMKPWFDRLGWTSDEQQVGLARDLLELSADPSDWLFTVGHHAIGGSCAPDGSNYKLNELFAKYPVTSYLHGHYHSLGYGYDPDTQITYFLSGAGGQDKDPCNAPADASHQLWTTGGVFGFQTIELDVSQNTYKGVYYFTTAKNLTQWQTKETQTFQRRQTSFSD